MEEAGLKDACLEVVGPKQAGLGKASLEKVGFEEAEVHDEQDHVNQETSTNVHHKLHEKHTATTDPTRQHCRRSGTCDTNGLSPTSKAGLEEASLKAAGLEEAYLGEANL